MSTLEKTGQLENTIVVFFSDHGCHFRTRMGEYKRSPHEAALRVPLIFAGPGFDQGLKLDELVSLLDMTPTLLDGCGVQVPSNMQGKTVKPLMSDAAVRKAWDSTVYIQISESMVGRAIRTKDWMFSVHDPEGKPNEDPYSKTYEDFAMYQLGSDPYQKLNLIGRSEYKEIANHLREELKKRIVSNGEPEPTIRPIHYFV